MRFYFSCPPIAWAQGFRFFSRMVGRSDPWSKKWWVIFWNDRPKYIKLTTVDIWVVYFTYTLTQTFVCIYVYWPVLSGHSKKKTKNLFSRPIMQVKSIAECSLAILSTFIKLSFVIKIFVLSFFEWLLKTGFTVLTTFMYFLVNGVCRLAVRWIFLLKWDFFTTKKDGSTGPTALKSDGPYFEIMGQWPGPTINLKACEHNAFCSICRHERKNSFRGYNSFGRKAQNYVLHFHLYHWHSSHYAVMHMRNKNSNIQGSSPNVVKEIFHTIRNCS